MSDPKPDQEPGSKEHPETRGDEKVPRAEEADEEIHVTATEAPEPPEATHGAEDETWETGGGDTPHLEEEVAALRKQVAELASEAQAMKDKWLRARADYDNLSRRTTSERETLTLQAAARVVGELLEPLDILQRAAADAEGVDDPHAQGIRLTYKSLRTALEREGLEDAPGLGSAFDVAVHEAIASEPSAEPAGTIVEVVRSGYLLKGRLLRPALVKVSAGTEEQG